MFYQASSIVLGICTVLIFLARFCNATAPPVCPVPTLQDLLLTAPAVTELDEATLEQALATVRSSNDSHMAVLYYASWCPFSKQLRPVFKSLSLMFPVIQHVEVEESAIRPGLLSKYGVHSFPVLYLYSGTSRFRYSGLRTPTDISTFYYNVTGLQPWTSKPIFVEEPELSTSDKFQTDTYLALATWFLVLRALLYVLPAAVTRVRNFWNRCHLYKMLKPRAQRLQQNDVHHDQGHLGGDRRAPIKRRFVPSWSHQIASPSSSLAIAESSARRVAPSEDLAR